MSTTDIAVILPRVIIVARRSLCKNKFVDFVGERHLDIVVKYGAIPVIIPRVTGIQTLLQKFEPIHGVLLSEGEEIEPSLDQEMDTVELSLAKLCLERNIPYLGICRGSQVLNVACGGTLYQDTDTELTPDENKVIPLDYENYDRHRHVVKIVDDTPLYQWFKVSIQENMEILVNSYNRQGVKRLAQRFRPMAFAPDGLVEGFYDPDAYNPDDGQFMIGLQFHPEQIRNYPGCVAAYKEFVKAVVAYQKKVNSITKVPKSLKLDEELEQKRKAINHSFSLARDVYERCNNIRQLNESGLQAGFEFLESNLAINLLLENRLRQAGIAKNNATEIFDGEREKSVRAMMAKMTIEQLSELDRFHRMRGRICSEILLEKKQLQNVNEYLL